MNTKSRTIAEEALDYRNDPAAEVPRGEILLNPRTRAQLDEQIARIEATIARSDSKASAPRPSADESTLTVGQVALARLRKPRDSAPDFPVPSRGHILSIGPPGDDRSQPERTIIVMSEEAILSVLEGGSTRVQPAAKPNRLLTLNEVMERIPVTRQTIDNWEHAGSFPQRVPLPDIDDAFWLEREIDMWISDENHPKLAKA